MGEMSDVNPVRYVRWHQMGAYTAPWWRHQSEARRPTIPVASRRLVLGSGVSGHGWDVTAMHGHAGVAYISPSTSLYALIHFQYMMVTGFSQSTLCANGCRTMTMTLCSDCFWNPITVHRS